MEVERNQVHDNIHVTVKPWDEQNLLIIILII